MLSREFHRTIIFPAISTYGHPQRAVIQTSGKVWLRNLIYVEERSRLSEAGLNKLQISLDGRTNVESEKTRHDLHVDLF